MCLIPALTSHSAEYPADPAAEMFTDAAQDNPASRSRASGLVFPSYAAVAVQAGVSGLFFGASS